MVNTSAKMHAVITSSICLDVFVFILHYDWLLCTNWNPTNYYFLCSNVQLQHGDVCRPVVRRERVKSHGSESPANGADGAFDLRQ